ncbi:MAG: FAD-dependent oxidoreductase, partial [Polyangiaceae bacterium]
MKRKLVCIGNGLVGTRAIDMLLDAAPGDFELTVFGAERHLPYDRIALSSVLAGEKSATQIELHPRDWYAEHGVRLFAGSQVSHIDREAKRVTAADGRVADYDVLLVATGSNPFMLPLPGADLPGVVSFRDIDDVEQMIAASESYGRAVVIGGGLLGLEAAHGLMQRGMQVTVVHLMDKLMDRQLDDVAARLLREQLEQRGMTVRLEVSTERIVGEDRVTGIRFANGEEIATDLVVMAVGVRPNITLAQDAGLECGRGIVVDDVLRTSDRSIYAIGECAQHSGRTYGLVAPLYEMCRVWAKHMAGEQGVAYGGSMEATRLKVAGIDVYSGGNFLGGDETECITM